VGLFLSAGGSLDNAAPDFFARHEGREAASGGALAADALERLLAILERMAAQNHSAE
jgi:hypothetical protein